MAITRSSHLAIHPPASVVALLYHPFPIPTSSNRLPPVAAGHAARPPGRQRQKDRDEPPVTLSRKQWAGSGAWSGTRATEWPVIPPPTVAQALVTPPTATRGRRIGGGRMHACRAAYHRSKAARLRFKGVPTTKLGRLLTVSRWRARGQSKEEVRRSRGINNFSRVR